MPSRKNLGLFIMASALTTMLSVVFMLMAPLPARYLRLSYGRVFYWAFAIISSSALMAVSPAWALSQFICLLVVGIYSDLEQVKLPMFYAALSSVILSGLSLFFLLSVWAKTQQKGLSGLLKGYINEVMLASEKVQRLPVEITPEMVLAVFPAIVGFMMMALLFMAVFFIKPQQNSSEKLSSFRAPDNVIWLFIISMAGTFLLDPAKGFYLHKFMSNAFYLLAAVYYFQGLAVLGFFFKRIRLHYFLKAGMFFIFAFHLFIFVAVLGLSDVWFSYRSKWHKKVVNNNP